MTETKALFVELYEKYLAKDNESKWIIIQKLNEGG